MYFSEIFENICREKKGLILWNVVALAYFNRQDIFKNVETKILFQHFTKCYLIINLLQPDKSHPVHLHQREGEGEREEPVHV